MVFTHTGFCGSLRGEEVPLISQKGLLTFWDETTITVSNPHIILTLHGRFKGESGVCWHCIPIACLARLGLQVKKWFARLMRCRVFAQGRGAGWLFIDDSGRRQRIGHHDPHLLEFLERVRS